MGGVDAFTLAVKKNDSFVKNELACIEAFVSDPEAEKKAVAIFSKTGIPQNTYRPCFVALKCVTIRGRLRVYAHITVEGDPVPKYTKSGSLKHPCGKGLVGVDLGPQSVAAVSETSAILENLAERNGKSTKRHERKERLLLRALDRSRRANNKDRYNEDGTKVQRDIYSAFLLLCHNDDFKTINQDICISKYETFKKAHDKCVSDIKASGHKVCNSGI